MLKESISPCRLVGLIIPSQPRSLDSRLFLPPSVAAPGGVPVFRSFPAPQRRGYAHGFNAVGAEKSRALFMQCVILAGGLGSRMRPLTAKTPKTLLPVSGIPFADYQLRWAAQHGVTEVVYSIARLGDQVRSLRRRRPTLGSDHPLCRGRRPVARDRRSPAACSG